MALQEATAATGFTAVNGDTNARPITLFRPSAMTEHSSAQSKASSTTSSSYKSPTGHTAQSEIGARPQTNGVEAKESPPSVKRKRSSRSPDGAIQRFAPATGQDAQRLRETASQAERELQLDLKPAGLSSFGHERGQASPPATRDGAANERPPPPLPKPDSGQMIASATTTHHNGYAQEHRSEQRPKPPQPDQPQGTWGPRSDLVDLSRVNSQLQFIPPKRHANDRNGNPRNERDSDDSDEDSPEPRPSGPPSHTNRIEGIRVKSKREFSRRTKTGCHTCRARKKKCDEAKPECSNCLKGNFICGGYEGRPHEFSVRTRTGAANRQAQQHQQQQQPPEYHQMPFDVPGGPRYSNGPMHPEPRYQSQPPHHFPHPPHPSHAPPSHHPYPVQPPVHHPERQSAPPGPLPPHHPPPPQSAPHPPPPPPLQQGGFDPHLHRQREGWQPGPQPGHSIHLQYTALPEVNYNNIPPPHSFGPSKRSYSGSSTILGPPSHTPAPPPEGHWHVQHRPSMPAGGAHQSYESTPTPVPPRLAPIQGIIEAPKARDRMLLGQAVNAYTDQDLLQDAVDCTAAVADYNNAYMSKSQYRQSEIAERLARILDPSKRAGAGQVWGVAPLKGRCGLRTIIKAPFYCEFGYNLNFGEDILIRPNCWFSDPCEVRIGNGCVIGEGVRFIGWNTSINPQARSGSQGNHSGGAIIVGDNVKIGAGAIILPFRHIGDGAVIGAGSVVTKNVRPRTVVCGNPAKLVRDVSEGEAETHLRTEIQRENENMMREMQLRVRQ